MFHILSTITDQKNLFQANALIEKIQHCKSLEEETDLKQQILNESKVPSFLYIFMVLRLIIR